MPKPLYVLPPDADWVRNTDFFYTGTIANATAVQTIVPSASGYYNCISKLMIDNQSGVSKLIQIQDNGTPTVMIEDFTVNASAGPFILDFPVGMEYKQPTVSKNIDLIANASGTVTYFVSGYRTK